MSGEHNLGGLTTELTPTAQSATAIKETARVAPFQDKHPPPTASSSGQHRAMQLEQIERARQAVSLAPTFDKLVDATLGLASSSEKLQAEVRRLVKATYVVLGALAISEAIGLAVSYARR